MNERSRKKRRIIGNHIQVIHSRGDKDKEEAFTFFLPERDRGGKLAKTSYCDCSLQQPNFRVGISQCKKISMQASKTDGRFFGGGNCGKITHHFHFPHCDVTSQSTSWGKISFWVRLIIDGYFCRQPDIRRNPSHSWVDYQDYGPALVDIKIRDCHAKISSNNGTLAS